jgi:hypothetical protein
MDETSKNQQIADQICREFQWNGRQFEAGECIALLDGEIVAVAASLDQALAKLRAIEPDRSRGMLFEVRQPVMDVIR